MATLNTVRIVPRKYENSVVTYFLHFTNPLGKRRRLSVGKDYQRSQRLAVKFNDWLLEGKDPEIEMERAKRTEQSKQITLRGFYPVFIERHGKLKSRNMQEIYRYRFKQLCRCPQLVEIPMSDVSKRLMLDYMHTRLEEKKSSAATVNREAALVKNMLFRAVEWDIIDRNPLQGLRLLKEAEKRQVNLTSEQATVLIKELPETTSSIVELAIYTGFRKENILGMRIESIRFHDLTSTGDIELEVKGGRIEVFPLSPAAVEAIKRNIGDRKRGYVFLNPVTGTRYNTIHKSFNRAVRKLGFTVNGTKLRFHDLRHLHATWLYQAGVSLDVVRSLLGHLHIGTTDRYVTYDRLSHSDVLSLIPKLNGDTKKETSDNQNHESQTMKNGTNWHGNDQGHMLLVPKPAVSP